MQDELNETTATASEQQPGMLSRLHISDARHGDHWRLSGGTAAGCLRSCARNWRGNDNDNGDGRHDNPDKRRDGDKRSHGGGDYAIGSRTHSRSKRRPKRDANNCRCGERLSGDAER